MSHEARGSPGVVVLKAKTREVTLVNTLLLVLELVHELAAMGVSEGHRTTSNARAVMHVPRKEHIGHAGVCPSTKALVIVVRASYAPIVPVHDCTTDLQRVECPRIVAGLGDLPQYQTGLKTIQAIYEPCQRRS